MTQTNDDREVPFAPELSPEYARRFDALTDELVEYPKQLDQEVTVKDEIRTIERNLEEEELSENRVRYLAVLEVLLDLIEIGHDVRKNNEFHVVRPDPDRYKDDPQEFKAQERRILEKERQTQFNEQTVRDFIREMEGDHRHNGDRVSVTNLITDGESLHADLAPLQDLPRDEIIDQLDDIIQPYVQIAEKGEKCEHTGLDLMDIWRYFRYTWLTPYNTVPGRNINFLIRDAAREHDPVMGIASLASPMMNLTVRDESIGWTFDGLKQRLEREKQIHKIEEQLPKEERTPDRKTRTVTQTEYLETEEEYKQRVDELCAAAREALEDAITTSIENIRYDDFIQEYDALTEERFTQPDDDVFDILEQIEEAAETIIENDDGENPENMESWKDRSETALFRKKRARTLQKLLRDRQYFENHQDQSDTEFIQESMETERGRRAIKTGLKEIKKRRAGAGMMNIMVCGAIPPYNPILGGKLVGMAVTGPKVINAYREKYDGSVSKIASSMKGEPVRKENEVVFYDTTGLFEIGSAQYDRIRVPASNGTIEYEELGYTQGYGSIQFGPSTRQRLSQVTQFEEGRRVVNGRFGEGVAPRMRKIRRGLTNCGLDGDLLKHESRRIVYGVELATDAKEYLRGETDNPTYYWGFENPEQEQQSIYNHWKKRWVSKRVQKQDVLNRIADADPDNLPLSKDIDFDQRQLSDFIVGNN